MTVSCLLLSLWTLLSQGAASLSDPSEEGNGYRELPPLQAASRQAVRDVLASREFRGLREEQPGWLQRLGSWLLEALRDARELLDSLPSFLGHAVLIWMLLTLVAVLGHLVYMLVKSLSGGDARRKDTRAGEGPGHGPLEALGIEEADFATVSERAREFAEAHQWGQAIRYLYFAMILRLSELGRLSFGRAKTNRDYLRELHRWPRPQTLLCRGTERFEPVVYGGSPATEETFREMEDLLESLCNEDAPRPAS